MKKFFVRYMIFIAIIAIGTIIIKNSPVTVEAATEVVLNFVTNTLK